jgi:hypothetical protein
MPHNMTPPLLLPDPPDAPSIGIEFPADGPRPIPAFPQRRTEGRKPPPVEDLALLLVVIGFVVWSVAFAYRMIT